MARSMNPPLDIAPKKADRMAHLRTITSAEEMKPHVALFTRLIAGNEEELAQRILTLFDGKELPSVEMVKTKKHPPAKANPTTAEGNSHDDEEGNEFSDDEKPTTQLAPEPRGFEESIKLLEKVTGKPFERAR